MKIVKRNKYRSLPSTLPIVLIPTFTYTMLKLGGTELNNMEFLWWIFIPVALITWLGINFKVIN